MINKTASRLNLPEVFKQQTIEEDSDSGIELDEFAEDRAESAQQLLNEQPSIENFMTEATKA